MLWLNTAIRHSKPLCSWCWSDHTVMDLNIQNWDWNIQNCEPLLCEWNHSAVVDKNIAAYTMWLLCGKAYSGKYLKVHHNGVCFDPNFIPIYNSLIRSAPQTQWFRLSDPSVWSQNPGFVKFISCHFTFHHKFLYYYTVNLGLLFLVRFLRCRVVLLTFLLFGTVR